MAIMAGFHQNYRNLAGYKAPPFRALNFCSETQENQRFSVPQKFSIFQGLANAQDKATTLSVRQ